MLVNGCDIARSEKLVLRAIQTAAVLAVTTPRHGTQPPSLDCGPIKFVGKSSGKRKVMAGIARPHAGKRMSGGVSPISTACVLCAIRCRRCYRGARPQGLCFDCFRPALSQRKVVNENGSCRPHGSSSRSLTGHALNPMLWWFCKDATASLLRLLSA